ncbi:plastocyanin/azurin family copper-binding protein [Pedobacter foliorum]|uniref:plastocyanin/azurin family copper-binding protein n=1 Tax=Pedobacter foliorum TaxID=2739058 RepID=UPI001564A41E|nr:plastocyanin/azurin family copper-binding protein [Pedobacter foliorum]NRF39491.1 auracyanin family protein [Pedobacter foliorum]
MKNLKYLLSLLLLGAGMAKTNAQTENTIFPIVTIPIPKEVALEVGGMTFLPNDELAVATRRGEVWIITNPYMKDGQQPKYRLFAHGMHEILGLSYIKGDLYLTQRAELTRLRDLDGDGEADEYRTMYSWPLSGNYHEYAYGPMLDKDGNMVVTLNLGWIGFGESMSKWHGWMLKFTPDFKMKPFATGFRSPAAFALNNSGDIFYAENQGDWVGSGSITHVEEGDFVGNPAGLIWADQPDSPVKLRKKDIPDTGEPKYDVAKRVPGLKTPSVWIPHSIMGNSTSGILSYSDNGNMGPFKGQLFVGDQAQSKISRVFLEKVKGVYQGMVFPFREGFSSGILRMNWGSDGSMLVGMTSRGWSSTGKEEYGLQRLTWSGVMPFEVQTVKAQPDGFELEFTMPVDEKTARNAGSYKLSTFTYKYHHIYGSPVINQSPRSIKAIVISPDHKRVRLVLDSLKEGYIHEIKTEGIRSENGNTPLLHNYGYYTLNKIPDGEKIVATDENKPTGAMEADHAMQGMDHHNMKNMASTGEKVTGSTDAGKHVTKQPESWKNGVVKTILLGTKPGLKFNITNLTLKAGTKVKLTFANTDDMLHNFVLTTPGSGNVVGEMVMKMGLDGEKYDFVPNSVKVIAHTSLLQPGKSDTIYFTVPKTPGIYPFICTYPGHYMVMKGQIKVVK